MSGRSDGRVDGRSDGRVDSRVDGRSDGRADSRVDGGSDGRVDAGSDGRVDPAEFRRVLGHYPTGVAVVTAAGAEPVGMAVNSFTSVSLEPPLVSFCAASSSSTWPRIRSAGRFAVNFLHQDQHHLCRQFSRSGVDRFEGVGWAPSATGSPLLDGAVAWLDCELEAEHPAGDHVIVVGLVRDMACREGRPIVFWRGAYSAVDPLDALV